MNDLRPEVEDREVLDLLARHFDGPIAGLERLEGGQIARTFAFGVGADEYVLRVDRQLGANVDKQAFVAQLLAGTDIPIPALLHRGRLDELFYAISRRAHGTLVSDLPPDARAALIPVLADMLDAIHAVDVSETIGYGPAGDDGNGLFPSWRAYLTAVREEEPGWDFYGTWHVLFETTFLERDVFDHAFAAMEHLLPLCPDERRFIHGNYGFGNVLAEGGRITAVLDWQEAGYGDPLLDVAQLDFWDAATGWTDAFQERYVQHDVAMPHLPERIRCYQLRTGLDALRFFAKKGDEGAYRWVRDRLDTIAPISSGTATMAALTTRDYKKEGSMDAATTTTTATAPAHTPYRVSVAEYITFRQQGFLVVRGLLSPGEVAELREHTEELMQGHLPEQAGHELDRRDTASDEGVSVQDLAAPPADLSPEEKANYFLRIHMLHRQLALHERYLLHPRVLDVLQALIGPDVLALQTMLFIKGPGKPGQGWHQDTYYIPTHPDTLCGAWMAIDDCDEYNGAMWFATGSQHEPVYPPRSGYGYGDTDLDDIEAVSGVSNPDDERNDLTKIANRYQHLLVPAKAGDVVFFAGHIMHRSKQNVTADRFRRSFVGHYCNARSFTQWGADQPTDPETGMSNGSHILARGDTHLPFALPRFGTPCAALLSPEERRREHAIAEMMMGDMDSGMMGAEMADPTLEDDH